MLCVFIRIAHQGDSNEYTQHTIIVTEIKKSLNYRYLLPDLAPWLTLSSSNYPFPEQFSMVPKMFEPLKPGVLSVIRLMTETHLIFMSLILILFHYTYVFCPRKGSLFVRLSLLTMTIPNQLCDVLLFVCSKMADETNLACCR